ncbi:MAG: ATP-grasp domain-containing protein [Bacteroidales bacterium]|nr:ATP-grasp domain-containing protein [Bacteroidales bacterium]MCB9000075.1 ATP-grasp domain-containing protein [Bacteroidales bacterium]MCB9012724.1 ATP-grasp domain-containing protein [Bacteroidales bacterium]
MFLIDKPFVSDFLVNTIKEGKYQIIASPEALELIPDDNLNWISEKEAVSVLMNKPETRIYLNSENSVRWINENLPFSPLAKFIPLFKDKVKFRQLLKELYPDFLFSEIAYPEIQKLNAQELKFPFVIKPAVGFFSLGVKIIRNIEDWESAIKEFREISYDGLYPKEVIDSGNFIIEEYIGGEEFAIDFYFNTEGEAVILGIHHHRFSSETDVSDRIYSTSGEIISRWKSQLEDFLNLLGAKTGLRNFPGHLEVRIDERGKISPIELNPARFGGWCTTADISWYAYGINTYDYFMQNRKPDWDEICRKKQGKIYSIVILNNNSGYTAGEIREFNYSLLRSDFKKILNIRKVDITAFPFFGYFFAETEMNCEKELDDILISDLKKYIILKSD